jgi:hypothetical protein
MNNRARYNSSLQINQLKCRAGVYDTRCSNSVFFRQCKNNLSNGSNYCSYHLRLQQNSIDIEDYRNDRGNPDERLNDEIFKNCIKDEASLFLSLDFDIKSTDDIFQALVDAENKKTILEDEKNNLTLRIEQLNLNNTSENLKILEEKENELRRLNSIITANSKQIEDLRAALQTAESNLQTAMSNFSNSQTALQTSIANESKLQNDLQISQENIKELKNQLEVVEADLSSSENAVINKGIINSKSEKFRSEIFRKRSRVNSPVVPAAPEIKQEKKSGSVEPVFQKVKLTDITKEMLPYVYFYRGSSSSAAKWLNREERDLKIYFETERRLKIPPEQFIDYGRLKEMSFNDVTLVFIPSNKKISEKDKEIIDKFGNNKIAYLE